MSVPQAPRVDQLAAELAFADGQTWVALGYDACNRYRDMARAAMAWGCDMPTIEGPDAALDAAYEEGYEDCRQEVEDAMLGGPGRRVKQSKRVAA